MNERWKTLPIVRIPYGKREMAFDVPNGNLLGFVEPAQVATVKDVSAATAFALDSPNSSNKLSEIVKSNERVVIAATDLTRPCPDHIIIPQVLDELNAAGVSDDRISIVIGLGLHRQMNDEEIVQKFISTYQDHGRNPEIWPMATWAAPYFVFSRILRLPVVSGGLGHGGRQHNPDEYMTVDGLRDFEKFVATFLYKLSE